MTITIHVSPSTVKTLTDQFQAALRRGEQRQRLSFAGWPNPWSLIIDHVAGLRSSRHG